MAKVGIEATMHGVFAPSTERQLVDIMTSKQSDGRDAPLVILMNNALRQSHTPEGKKIMGVLSSTLMQSDACDDLFANALGGLFS